MLRYTFSFVWDFESICDITHHTHKDSLWDVYHQNEAETKWLTFCGWQCQMYLFNENILHFKWKFVEIFSNFSCDPFHDIAVLVEMMASGQTGVFWTKDGLFYQYVYVSLGLNELLTFPEFLRVFKARQSSLWEDFAPYTCRGIHGNPQG